MQKKRNINYFVKISGWLKLIKYSNFCFNGKISSLKRVIKKHTINAIYPNLELNQLKRFRKVENG